MSIFSTDSYREVVLNWVKDQPHGVLSRMAEALQCQNSHLSRVLNGHLHFVLDQAYAMSEFLNLGSDETDYFMSLVEFERSANPRYKTKLVQKMKSLKRRQENLSERFQLERIGEIQKEAVYYSSWMYSAIHILTTIPAYQEEGAISERLSLSLPLVRSVLSQLEQFGLVKKAGAKWKTTSEFIHLPKASPMNSVQNGNWRSRAVLKSQDYGADDLHYTVVQSLSRKDFEVVKQLFLDVLSKYKKVADPSKEEELACLCLDFFKV